MRFFLTILICLFAAPTLAAEKLDYTYFEQLPVLDNGRIKPLGAFAKTRMIDFYGDHKNANQWLAETIFNPSEAVHTKIFSIKDNDLKSRLNLNREANTFSIADLESGLIATQKDIVALLQNESGDLTIQQEALLKIHEDALSYNELLRTFSLLLPLEDDRTFQDLLPQEQRIIRELKSIIAQKGEDITNYTAEEQRTALLGFELQQIRAGGQGNDDFKIIPSSLNNKLEWIAPWQIINEGKGSPVTSEVIALWSKVAQAYRDQNTQEWFDSTQNLYNKTLNITDDKVSTKRLKTELFYQAIKPYHIAMGFYALGILLLFFGRKNAAFLSLLVAFTSHTFGILARIYILDRPPVGTLYESVLFVSLICGFMAGASYIINRKPLIPLTGQIAALGLLAVAPSMLQNNDSLELLVAVLNTNFWLATHVLCITAGYGVCILAACLSHAYMIIRLKNAAHKLLDGLFQSIHKIGLIALLLTSVGTVLGGIWADQSWGRFWGWDPKENGALLIVLWLIWIQHGRLSGNIRPLSYVAGMAALNIIVAVAWFGVNLLGVGLHSYGFTSGIASGLAIFCAIEAALISSLWFAVRRRERKAAA